MFDKILQKLGIKSIDDLKPEERKVWLQWSAILGRGDITLDDLKKFLPIELERANVELRNRENSPQKDMYFKAYGDLLATIMKFILTSTQEREQLKAMLKQKYEIE